ncbi:hypothetical protein Trydic_g8841 [Trypoxylus dichotomus]
MDLSGMVALVTGGAGGIGKGCVEQLLKYAIKGVTIADINDSLGEVTTKEFNEKYGSGKVLFVKTDVSNKESFENAFQKTVEHYDNIDILINNAGLMNEINWELSVQVNLMGTITGLLLAVEKYFPQHKSGEKAYIVNLSSIAGLVPSEFCPVYSATKHGVIGLTRSYGLNRHLKRNGIVVAALCPSGTDSSMADYMGSIVKYKDIYEEAFAQFSKHSQTVDAVGRAAIEAMIDSDSGSAWFIENGKVYKVNFPLLEQIIGRTECNK